MDAITRYWCELRRFEYLSREASAFDSQIYYGLPDSPTKEQRERWEWFKNKAEHQAPSPGGEHIKLLLDGFPHDDALAKLDEFARLANEERYEPDRYRAIRRALAAIKKFYEVIGEADGRELCECEHCEEFRCAHDGEWDDVTRRLNRAMSSLGFYVPAEWKRYLGEDPIPVDDDRQADTKNDTPKKIRKMSAAAAGAAKLYREMKSADDTTALKQAVADYVDQHGGSVESIYRTLNDNPEQWQ